MHEVAVDERGDVCIRDVRLRCIAVDELELREQPGKAIRTVPHPATSHHLGARFGERTRGGTLHRVALKAAQDDGADVLRNSALAAGEHSQDRRHESAEGR